MITIKDMAEIAGVSPTTVANVLHGRTKKMSKETLKKVERLRKDPDEELFLVAEPDMICANCPNRTETNECVHNHNRVVNKDRRVIEFFGLEENRVYTYREMCRHARAAMNADHKIARIVLEVRVSNEGAVCLYEKQGFSSVGIRRGFYEFPREDARIMVCAL